LITKAYKRLDKNLKDPDSHQKKRIRVEQTKQGSSAAETIPRIAEVLDLPPREKAGAQKVAREAASYLEGKQPATIAAAAILFHLRHITPMEAIKDKDVASAAHIASSTLRSAFRVLEENAAELRSKLS